MAAPVDPARAFRVSRGRAVRSLYYRAFDPAADAHAAAPGEACSGVCGPRRVAEEGGVVVTRRTWTVTGTAARPVLRSLLVDGAESWVVRTADPDPAGEAVFVCDTYKA